MEFETTIRMDHIAEVQKAAYPKKAEITIHVICGVFLLLTVYHLIGLSFAAAVIYAIGAGAMEFILYHSKKRIVKLIRERLAETGTSELRYRCEFTEDALSIANLITGGKTNLPYAVFAKYFETVHYALLMTKSRQMVILELEQAKRYQVKEFLQAKNPTIK